MLKTKQEYLLSLNVDQIKVYIAHVVAENRRDKIQSNLPSRINEMICLLKGSNLAREDYAKLSGYMKSRKGTEC